MAEGHRMTAAELVAKVMAGEHGDFVREAVALIAHELMEAEISVEVGAELHEVSPQRTTHRNGYRPRPWETRVGEIELLIPESARARPISRASLNHAGAASRRSWQSCSRHTSTASPRARSTAWSSSWASPA